MLFPTFLNRTTGHITLSYFQFWFHFFFDFFFGSFFSPKNSTAQVFCPFGYSCLVDQKYLPAPYIGCFSTSVPCEDQATCAFVITSLPNANPEGTEKLYSLYLPSFISISQSLLLVIACFLTGTVIYLHYRTKLRKLMLVLQLTQRFIFIIFLIVSAFYFEYQLQSEQSTDCYDGAVESILSPLLTVSICYLVSFVLACTAVGISCVYFVVILFGIGDDGRFLE